MDNQTIQSIVLSIFIAENAIIASSLNKNTRVEYINYSTLFEPYLHEIIAEYEGEDLTPKYKDRDVQFNHRMDYLNEKMPYDFKCIYYLKPARGKAHSKMLKPLAAWCEKNVIPCKGAPVNEVKKFITGKGNANKAAVLAAVESLGYDEMYGNTASAIALQLFAIDKESQKSNRDIPF